MIRIGIDLGGTKIEAVAMNAAGEILARERRPTPGSYGALLDTIVALIAHLESDYGPAKVGVGHPGSLSPKTGHIRNANSQWLNGRALGSDLEALGQAELLLSDSALDALALSQHSRNLLLVEQRVAQDSLARQRARIRPIASPEGASCVERLLDPYPALLERQLTRMHESRAH